MLPAGSFLARLNQPRQTRVTFLAAAGPGTPLVGLPPRPCSICAFECTARCVGYLRRARYRHGPLDGWQALMVVHTHFGVARVPVPLVEAPRHEIHFSSNVSPGSPALFPSAASASRHMYGQIPRNICRMQGGKPVPLPTRRSQSPLDLSSHHHPDNTQSLIRASKQRPCSDAQLAVKQPASPAAAGII